MWESVEFFSVEQHTLVPTSLKINTKARQWLGDGGWSDPRQINQYILTSVGCPNLLFSLETTAVQQFTFCQSIARSRV